MKTLHRNGFVVEPEDAIISRLMILSPDEIRSMEAEQRQAMANRRAHAFTSGIHETRRVEEKALLASDEAVSHGLKGT